MMMIVICTTVTLSYGIHAISTKKWTSKSRCIPTVLHTSKEKGVSMTPRLYDEKELARFAADTMVLILFVVLLNVILVFGILLYALAWLVGLT